MDDYTEELAQKLNRRVHDQRNENNSTVLKRVLARYYLKGWIGRYLIRVSINWLTPTLAVSGLMALAISIAGWSVVPKWVWFIPPLIGLFFGGAYAYRDKEPPRTVTAGQMAIFRRGMRQAIGELQREQRQLLGKSEEQRNASLKRADLNHLLAHCEIICQEIAAFDSESADTLRDAATRIDKEVIGGRRGAVIFPTGENPNALLVARNLDSWIRAATDIIEVLAPQGGFARPTADPRQLTD